MIYSLITLGILGGVAAIILYFVAQKFKVVEDPRIDEVADLLPNANCGGCGFAGCRAFAESIVKTESLAGMSCPPGGAGTMESIGKFMGLEPEEIEPQIAVIRCNGSKTNAPAKVEYDGVQSCFFANRVSHGESGCQNSCLGLGDCVVSCDFDAIYIDEKTGLPVVSEEKCVACGACVTACPRFVIELRNKGKKDRRIFVSCVNSEKGAHVKKNCAVACIGCGKCVRVCPFDAITLKNNLAYIDYEKCKLCRKCVLECPTGAIHEINFPERKPKPVAKVEKPVAKTEKPKTETVIKSEKVSSETKNKEE